MSILGQLLVPSLWPPLYDFFFVCLLRATPEINQAYSWLCNGGHSWLCKLSPLRSLSNPPGLRLPGNPSQVNKKNFQADDRVSQLRLKPLPGSGQGQRSTYSLVSSLESNRPLAAIPRQAFPGNLQPGPAHPIATRSSCNKWLLGDPIGHLLPSGGPCILKDLLSGTLNTQHTPLTKSARIFSPWGPSGSAARTTIPAAGWKRQNSRSFTTKKK